MRKNIKTLTSFIIWTLILCSLTAFAENGETSVQKNFSIKALYWNRIHPVPEDGKWRFINCDGEFIDENLYDFIVHSYNGVTGDDDHTIYHGKKDDKWYKITAAKTEFLSNLPEGCNITQYLENGRYVISFGEKDGGMWRYWNPPFALYNINTKKYLIKDAQWINSYRGIVRCLHYEGTPKSTKDTYNTFHYICDGKEIHLPQIEGVDPDRIMMAYFGEGLFECTINDEPLAEFNPAMIKLAMIEIALNKKDDAVRIKKEKRFVMDSLTGEKLFDLPKNSMFRSSFINGISILSHDNQYFLIDKKGIKLSAGFDRIERPNGELIKVKSNSKIGYINRFGEQVVPCDFEDGTFFKNGIAIVKDSEYSYHVIDIYGNIIQRDALQPKRLYELAPLVQYGITVRKILDESGSITAHALYNAEEKLIWKGKISEKEKTFFDRYYNCIF